MAPNVDRIRAVYRTLGRVLKDSGSFGLGDRVPKPLADALTEMRAELREELQEEEQWLQEDLLAAELSQDSDSAFAVRSVRRE